MDKFTALRVFTRVVEHGGFTAAANSVFVVESYSDSAYVTEPVNVPGLSFTWSNTFTSTPAGYTWETVAATGTSDVTPTSCIFNSNVFGPGAFTMRRLCPIAFE